MGQTAFLAFEMVASWKLMSLLMSDVSISLKWLTVMLKIEMAYKHRTNCFLRVSHGAELQSHVSFDDRYDP